MANRSHSARENGNLKNLRAYSVIILMALAAVINGPLRWMQEYSMRSLLNVYFG